MSEDNNDNDFDDTMTSSDFSDDEKELDFGCERREWMPYYFFNEQQPAESMEKMTTKFVEMFDKHYPSSNLRFCAGFLDEALGHSIFHPELPRPLMLYIRHGNSTFDNIFCQKFFCDKGIVDLLNSKFIIWPWDQTDMNCYRLLLKFLIEHFGSKITKEIVPYSSSPDKHPLLVFFAMTGDRYTILNIINSEVQNDSVLYSTLETIRQDFDNSNSPSGQNSIEKWHMPYSQFTSINHEDEKFQEIATLLNLEMQTIKRIEKIENIIWSVQYSIAKSKLSGSTVFTPREKQVFYGCPSSIAVEILQYGFDLCNHCIHGEKHGCGFYFSSERHHCEQYKGFDEVQRESNAIIICRILVDHSQRSNNSKIYVLRHNEHIHPEYLVLYDK